MADRRSSIPKSRQPVHQRVLHRTAQSAPGANQHGRSGLLARQRVRGTLKYEEVYLKGYESVSEAKRGIGDWMHYYNESRPHQSLAYKTPREVYDEGLERVSRAT